MRLIDAHCHVNFQAYAADADEVIRRSLAKGIGLATVGTQFGTSAAAIVVAEKYDDVWAIIGLHPSHLFDQPADADENEAAHTAEVFDPDTYRRLAKSSRKVVALGECGLDYYHVPEGVDVELFKSRQREVFRAHLELANELVVGVMIHSRDAADDLTAILGEYHAAGRLPPADVHCFTGTWAEAQRYLNLGLFISFTGIVTYPQRKIDREAGLESLQSIVAKMPLDRLIVETDAPYLAPTPYRGKRNEPAYVERVAEEVARIKGLPVEEVERATLANTQRLFGINSK
jgi:TatD DNase family protein